MANVQTGENKDSTKLISNLDTTSGNLKKLSDFLDTLDKLLEDTLTILQVPKDVSESLTDLENLLQTMSGLLQGVEVIPPITAPAKALRTAVDNLRRMIQPIRKQANRIDKQMDPYRERLEEIRSYLQQILPQIESLNSFTTLEKALMGETDSANSSQPDSRYKRTGRQELETLAKGITKDIVKPMETIVEMINSMEAIGKALDLITKLCSTLSDILKPMLMVMEALSNLRKPMNELNKALDLKVGFKWISVSIRDLLSGDAVGFPFTTILKKMAMGILGKLMSGLKLDVATKIPGVGQVVGLFKKVLGSLGNIQEIMGSAQPQMTGMFKQKSLENIINKHDV